MAMNKVRATSLVDEIRDYCAELEAMIGAGTPDVLGIVHRARCIGDAAQALEQVAQDKRCPECHMQGQHKLGCSQRTKA